MSRQRLSRRESQVVTRTRLLDAAAEVFAEHGVAGASVERIADRAGYTRGAFYGHFADKDAVVAALLEERTRREREEVAQLAASEGDTWEALRAWHRERSAHLEEWLALRLELVRHALRRPRGERSVLAEREAYAREALTGAVARELGTDTAEAAFTALIVHALEDGLAIQRAIDPGSVPPDAIVTATEIVLRGARTAGEPRDDD
ncbi:transcriptional regulator, TetR family [Saccharopolyspora kobensis]|uniref:Transcriptional regulator, TetR family n=1 Tax=Saccharopolyspora kobensis TaxID=146035 RepID=A0A1H5UZV9_9PSEU|nr:TetR/AcrR family transcriptional regulator [Saccharopolyspora kobensis]SEF80494.1 transcriptional regulator, TetR family [Saccharopolyspora kobensis]SFC67185.1 transcriptional regulator, TetR family [Saccharopolyspora kobensis]